MQVSSAARESVVTQPSTRGRNVMPKVSVRFKNTPRGEALRLIAKAAGWDVVYSQDVTQMAGDVSGNFQNMPLDRAVLEVLKNSGVQGRISFDAKAVFLAPARARDAQDSTGRIRGKVVDSAGKRPVASATVNIGGTNHRTMTDETGTFVFEDLPPGRYMVTVRRLGYNAVTVATTVQAQQDANMTLVLSSSVTTLAAVVTTGSGERERYKVGNSIATISADSIVANSAIRTLADLLANRAPGLQVLKNSGTVGAPSRLRMRGISSITSSNDPIIIIDGVRMANDYTRCRENTSMTGCFDLTSRMDDIDPHNIESIDVLKGPAASTLFGSEAANGVIVIKTKRGRAGPPRWTFRADQGVITQSKDFPVPLLRMGTQVWGGGLWPCSLASEGQGYCFPTDSVASVNLLKDKRTTSLATGRVQMIGGDVSGGNAQLQYFLSGAYSDQLGTAKLPEINEYLIRKGRGGDPLPSWMKRPNGLINSNVNGRMTGQLGNSAEFAIGAGFIQQGQRLGSDGMSSVLGPLRDPSDTTTPVAGWESFYLERTQDVSRTLGNITITWRPSAWFLGTVTAGRDFSLTDDRELAMRGSCVPLCMSDANPGVLGQLYGGRNTMVDKSFNLGGTFTIPVNAMIDLRTATGAQYVLQDRRDVWARASNLQQGRSTFTAASDVLLDESSRSTATLGVYIDQSVAFNDRLFVGAALRRDYASAMGPESVLPIFPKWMISWVASQESFFPWKDRVNLRLRAAFGHAGVQPGPSARFRTYAQSNRLVNPDGGALGPIGTVSGVGNPEIRPERSIEREGGFELGAYDDRVTLDVTWFRKFTADALVDLPLAPSLGLPSARRQWQNVGNVLNTGTEATLRVRAIDLPLVTWNVSAGYGSRKNKLVTLGPGMDVYSSAAGYLDGGGDQADARIAVGYPVFGRWARPVIAFHDADGDGILVPTDVRVGDSLVYMGPSEAKYDLGLHNDVGLFNDRVRIAADFQFVKGLTQLNKYRADNVAQLPAGQFLERSSLEEQANIIAQQFYGTSYGFFETVDFFRFSTFSVSYNVPPRFAQMMRARLATVAVLGTNLGIWTNYNGRDPDVNSAPTAGNQYFNGSRFPQARTWTLRLTLSF